MPVESLSAGAKEIRKYQLWMELGLGVVTPGSLAAMMITYVVANWMFFFFLVLALASSFSVLWPLKKLRDLSYQGWHPHTIPRSLIVAAIGIIYITEVGIFSAAMLSTYEGFHPENPLTLAVAVSLVIGLIGVMAYNDKYKDRLDRTHRRMAPVGIEDAHVQVQKALDVKGHAYTVSKVGNASRINVSSIGIMIDLRPVSTNSTELLMEIAEGGDGSIAEGLRSDISFH